MLRRQRGFTIIELVVVIVILGILAAVAFPKFQSLSTDAKTAVVNGGMAAFKSAAIITFAKNQGLVPTRLSVTSQVQADGVTFGGSCPSTVTVTYIDGTVTSTIATVALSGFCSG